MTFPQLAMGQVSAVYPDEYTVEVVFPNLSTLTGVRVKVLGINVNARAGSYAMPERGDWGLVFFYQDDWRSTRWLGFLTDAYTNSIPLEALSQDKDLQVRFDRSGRESYLHGSGDLEVHHPDGSLFRVTHSDDAPDKRTERYVGERDQDRKPKRVKYRKADKGRMQVYFQQADRTRFTLDQEGNAELLLSYPGGTRSLRYRLSLSNTGAVRVKNQPGSVFDLGADGSVTVSNAVSGETLATIQFTPTGDIVLTPGPAGRALLGREGAVKPVAEVGDQTPKIIAPNGNVKVFTL